MFKPKYNKISLDKDWDMNKLRSEGEALKEFVERASTSMLNSGSQCNRHIIRRIQVKEKQSFMIDVKLIKAAGKLEILYDYITPDKKSLISLSNSYTSIQDVSIDLNKILDTLDDKFFKIKKKKK